MAKKIMISVSVELFERLQAVKDRISISGVCQEALESAIRLQEIKMSTQTDESVLARLQAEKEDYDKQYEEDGYQNGLKDVKEMSYEEILEVVNSKSLWETDYYENVLKDCDYLRDKYEDDDAFNETMWYEGWQRGVQEFYESIKDRL